MTSAQSLHLDTHCCHVLSIDIEWLIIHCAYYVHTACTTDCDFTLSLTVEVEKVFPLKLTGFQTEGTIHAGFLVFGNQYLKRTVHNVFVFNHSHGCGNPHSVVASESSALGTYPFAVDVC